MFDGIVKKSLEIIDSTKSSINSVKSAEVHALKLNLDFIKSNDCCKKLESDLKLLSDGRAALYVFAISESDQVERVADAFRKARGNVENLPRDHGALSNILYVGSSRNLPKRLRDHFGLGSAKTYGLKLNKWLPADVSLELHYAFYSQETGAIAIAALEDALWEVHKPMFGRKGGK